jgi:16S rRNA (guanine527-N7)-methyltransferase
VKSRSDLANDLAIDRARALALTPVSRETAGRLDRFVDLLQTWQQTTNLIAASTLPNLWTRHVADSIQLMTLAPSARTWIDFGTGGGFPGLVLACVLADDPGATIYLVESNAKKAAFLREAQREVGVPAIVCAERMETFTERFDGPVEVVTSRAVAPLKILFQLSFTLLRRSGVLGLFPKGKNVEQELAEASVSWSMHATLVQSRTDGAGRIVIVRDLERRGLAI